MAKKYLLLSCFTLFLFFYAFFVVVKSNAATLSNTSDTLGTSRPSASAPITANQAANATQVTIFDNGSIFLASDSATLRPDTGETLNTVTVASMSASNTPSAGQRIVYFNSTASNTHHNGDPITSAITAVHKIQFTTVNAIPASGKIVITFPGSADNTASPSATTFPFNNLTSGNIAVNNATCTWTISSPTLSCVVTSSIAANTTVTVLVGCSAQSGGNCSTPVPTLINPTKTAAAGTADIWILNLKTQDSNSIDIDTSRIKIGTVEAVQVQATVDPILTVTIAGLANNVNFNTSSSGCASETTNSGIAATATTVDLGNLGNGAINRAGQTITVTTNASFGYVITATSSGRLIDASTGNWILDANGGNGLTANDTPAPATLPASGNASFGIAPCGARPPTSSPDWDDELALAFGSGGKLSNPWNSGTNSYYATIASYAGGVGVSSDITVIRYAATIAATTPAGIYTNYFTYVVTPVF